MAASTVNMHSGIIYSSGITIDDSATATLLAVFYETVYLPSCKRADAVVAVSERVERRRPDPTNSVRIRVTQISSWQAKWRPLFEEKVFVRLDDTDSASGVTGSSDPPSPDMLFRYVPRLIPQAGPADFDFIGFLDMVFHLDRKDLTLPRIFAEGPTLPPDRASLVAIEASAAFHYFLPSLRSLEPDETLELRRCVKDTREGFTLHLQKLSKDHDDIVKNGGTLEELRRHAQSIVETDLIPDYEEYKRQMASLSAGRLSKVLDAASKIAEIDAAPWTPKFWAMLVKALGMTYLVSTEEHTETLSNRYQAYEFVRTIEDAGRRRVR